MSVVFSEKRKFFAVCTGIVFACLLVVFSFYLSSFYIGNHDYRFMRYGVPLMSGVWEGRLTQFVLPWVLFGGQVLPIINVFIGFIFFAAAAVLLAEWYGLRKSYLTVISFALIIVLNPYILSQLYYVHSIVSILVWPLCCVGGLIWLDRGLVAKNVLLQILGAGCLFIALCGYIGVFECILTVLGGKILLELAEGEKRFSVVIKRYFPLCLTVLIVAVLFLAMISFLKTKRLINSGMYNVQILSIQEIYSVLGKRLMKPWKAILTPPPYCSAVVDGCLIGLMGLAGWCAVSLKRFWQICGCAVILIYAMFVLAFLSPYDFFLTFRIHFFSVPYFAAVMYALILQNRQTIMRNMALVLAVIFF